jgi:hypothetical protein
VIKRIALATIVSLILIGCAPAPARITIRTAQDPNACPLAGLPLPMRFRIDPLAQEHVVAIGVDGWRYLVWWAPGFQAGYVTDPVVRDPNGGSSPAMARFSKSRSSTDTPSAPRATRSTSFSSSAPGAGASSIDAERWAA